MVINLLQSSFIHIQLTFVNVVQVHVFTFLIPYYEVRYDFRVKLCSVRFYYNRFGGVSCFIYVICINLRIHWCQKMILYDIIFISFNSHTKGTIGGAGPAYRSDAHEFDSCFCMDSHCTNFSCLCSVLFVFFLLATVLPVF